MVNWDAVGAIGEILGAIAVMLTLIYLAKQVAETKRAIRRQASNDVNNMFNDVHHVIASSPGLTSALEKLEKGDAISRSEWHQVRSMFLAQMNAFENLYTHAEHADDFVGMGEARDMTRAYLDEPYVMDLWEENKVYLSDNFIKFVEG